MKHWFECIENSLIKMEENKKKFILSLIHNPLNVSKSEIKKYVPKEFLPDFLRILEYLSFSLKNNKSILNKTAKTCKITVYFNKDGESIIIDNAKLIYNDYKERIKEDLTKNNYKEWICLSKIEKASLCTIYFLSDLITCLLTNLITINGNNVFSLNDNFLESYKMLWFSRYFTQQSHISDYLMLDGLYEYVNSRNSPVFQSLIDNILDKHMSLHPNYSKYLNKKDQETFMELRRLTEIISYLSFKNRKNIIDNNLPKVIISQSELISFGFLEEDIDKLFTNIEKLKINNNDRFITKIEENKIRLNNINLKFALQTNLSSYLTNMNERGIWFEEGYILKYLKDYLDSRFIVTKGIDNKKEKYDSDIIIYDKNSNLIYFCQIKHRIKTTHPFFRDEFNEYCNNESLNHGIEQLCALRDKIQTKQVKERIISRLGKNIADQLNLDNDSRFILLHSIENLDMCTKNGISMYEWNTFRNLLNGSLSYFKDYEINQYNYNNKSMDFSNIAETQSYLIKELHKHYTNLGAKGSPVEQWDILKTSRILFEFNITVRVMNKSLFPSKWKYLDIPLII